MDATHKKRTTPPPRSIVARYRSMLPTMPVRGTVVLLRQCIVCLTDNNKRRLHDDARRIKELIHQEWQRRRMTGDPEQFFEWPSTEVNGGGGEFDTKQWLTDGLLSFMGYHVGHSSELTTSARQALLAEVFHTVFPPVFPGWYLVQCGGPRSAHRLQKMAETIAALTRNAKRRGSKMNAAVRDWERDLEFLYYGYYVERFHFVWPSTQ